MDDAQRDPSEPVEHTHVIATGPNPTGHTDMAQLAQQREFAPDVAADVGAPKRARKSSRRAPRAEA